MSIILKALRSQTKEERESKITLPPQGEGFFLGKVGFLKKRSNFPPKWVLLLGLLVLGIFFILTLWSLRNSSSEKTTTKEVPTPNIKMENKTPSQKPSLPSQEDISEVGRAQQLFKNGNFNESLNILEKQMREGKESVQLHNDLGLVFLKKELFSSAEKHFSRALELDDQCAECFNNFGYLKTLLGENVEAETYLKKAAQLNRNYPDPYFNLGILYEKNGDIGNAVQAYQKFLERSPNPQEETTLKIENRLKKLTGDR